MIPAFLTIKSLAFQLDVSTDTIEVWTAEGILPSPIKPKGKRLWSWKAVEARLAAAGGDVLQSAEVDPFVAGVERAATERKRHGRAA